MLVNELHQGGIRALLDWDNTIFDNMALPEGVALADVADHIIYKYGDAPLFTPDPDVIKFYIGRWSARRLPLWERYKAAIEIEYNPIENYDRQEESTRTPNLTHTQTGSIADAHTGTITDQHTGSVTSRNTGDVTDQRAADNSSSWENYDKSSNDLTDQTTNNLTDKRQHGDTVTKTFNNVTDFETGTDKTISRIHGNIGVTTSQQMLISELDLIPRLDIIDYIADDWHSEFCLLMY